MSMVTYQTVLRLISSINTFAEQSDQKIQQLWSNFNNSKQRLEEQYNQFMASASAELNNSTTAIRKKAESLQANADTIYRDVQNLDSTLANVDKHYVKTRKKIIDTLSQNVDTFLEENEDIFVALEKVKERFQTIASKYSKESSSAFLDSIHFMFSSQRKQDYEELVVLKKTLENLREEIKQTVSELTGDSTQTYKDNYSERTTVIKSKYQAELAKINARYETSVEALADDICRQLDELFPDSLLRSLSATNKRYHNDFSEIVSSYRDWDGNIIIGHIDYPLELYVSSNILFSLIRDKCAGIVTQKKLLRFPLVFSLKKPFAVLAKHSADGDLKNQFICSIMQALISSVPVTHLSFCVIDSENQGSSLSALAEFYKKLPGVFENKIVSSNDDVESSIERLSTYINETAQYKLGSIYNSIFEYTKDNPNEPPIIKFIVVFDSPQSLGEHNLLHLNNIIENGSRCGVFVIIGQNIQENALPLYHEPRCVIVQQSVDMFLHYNLRVTYNEALSGKDLSRYANKYLLLFDSINDNAALLDSVIREMIVNDHCDEIQERISLSENLLETYKTAYGVAPSDACSFPSVIPVGKLSSPLDLIKVTDVPNCFKNGANAGMFTLPAIFKLDAKNNLLITSPEAIHQHIGKFVHGLMWSFSSFIPVSKVNFCVFDADRRGNSITPFLDFYQKIPEIFDGQIYTAQDAMMSRLQKMNRYIDDFIQEKLGNRFKNIVEYNLNTPNRAEPITVLIIFDFPRNFDSRSIELLQNILSNGCKCGIYTIICHNPGIVFSKYENIEEHLSEIKKHCSLIEYIDRKYVLQPYGLPIDIAPELSKNSVVNFIDEYIKTNMALKLRGLSFEDAVRPPFFTASTVKKLSIPVGIGDGESVINLVLGEGSSHHGIIAGATGSGKSTLLHTIIMSSMLCHSPDELHLYLMDFKSGTEFKIYEAAKPPHIQLLALDAMQEFGESILENLVSEMLRRGSLFKETEQSSLHDYIKSTGKALPRILVVMDEFQVLFNDSANRKVALNCAELTKRIITEGRSFGIHLLMATQTTKVISELTLSHGVIEQMRIRIGLKCGTDDVRYLFGDRNDSKALEMMKGPLGTAVMNLEYMESNNTGFRAAYCSKESQKKYLSLISEKYAGSTSCTVFEGNRTVSLVDYLMQNKIGLSEGSTVEIHMGTLIKVAPPLVINLDRRRRHNLLICGGNDHMAENLANLCIFSALLNTQTDVYCIDGESLIGDSKSDALYTCLTDFTSRFKMAKNRAEIISFINDLHSIYSERKKENKIGQTVVIIKNIQFLDIVKKMFKGESVDENEFTDGFTNKSESGTGFDFGVQDNFIASSMSVTEKIQQLIDDGTNYGLFFIVSSLEYQTVKENMYYGENILSKFPERIVFALSNNDADNLIDGVSVSSLRDNTVYYSDGIKGAFQFKPYIMPDTLGVKEFLESLSVNGKMK